MPHLGQSPGRSDSTPSHIGQKYFAPEDGCTLSCRLCPAWQQDTGGFGAAGFDPQQDFSGDFIGNGPGKRVAGNSLIPPG